MGRGVLAVGTRDGMKNLERGTALQAQELNHLDHPFNTYQDTCKGTRILRSCVILW